MCSSPSGHRSAHNDGIDLSDRQPRSVSLAHAEQLLHVRDATTVLTGDIAVAIHDLKAQQEADVLVPGSGVLVRWLLANDLIDQYDLLIYPVVIGQGIRLFPDSDPDRALDLINSRTTSGGIIIQTYRPLGRRREYVTSSALPEHII